MTPEQANELARRVRAGQITENQARTEVGLPPKPTDPPRGFVSRPATALATSALEAEGLTTNQARERVTRLGAEAFGAQVEQQRALEQQAYERRQALIAASSPDDNRRAALASLAEKDKLQQDARLARESLANSQGIALDDLGFLSDADAVRLAFAEPDTDNELAANVAATRKGEST